MIGQEMTEMIPNRNLTDIVKIVIWIVIPGNIAGRCKPMQRKQEALVNEDPICDDDLD